VRQHKFHRKITRLRRLCSQKVDILPQNGTTIARGPVKTQPPTKAGNGGNSRLDSGGEIANLPAHRMNLAPESIGIIAGNRSLPLEFARLARAAGVKRIVAAAAEGETDPTLAELVDDIVWLKVGQLGKLITVFTDRKVKQCVMLGQIAPKNLFDLRPDLRAMGVLLRLKEKNAHTIFGAIANELKKDGVDLIEATPWLVPLMPQAGFQIGPKLSAEQREDVEFGFKIAKETSRLEIGQLVVVKNGAVLAVEGFEGTDKCLARGGELAGKDGGAVAVKVAKTNHDMRFDVPCLGAQTLETCAAARISVLAIESGKSLLLEREACEELARKNRIAVTVIG
jgi:DUF1009 family protein